MSIKISLEETRDNFNINMSIFSICYYSSSYSSIPRTYTKYQYFEQSLYPEENTGQFMVRKTHHIGDTQKVAILAIVNSDPMARMNQYISLLLTSSSSSLQNLQCNTISP